MPITMNRFGDISKQIHKAAHDIVNETCMNVLSDAYVNAPVLTGFMADNIYVVTSDMSTYGQSSSTDAPGDSYLLDEIDPPPDDQTGYITGAANYTIYVEMGTIHQAPQPFIVPAIEANRQAFTDKMSRIGSRLD